MSKITPNYQAWDIHYVKQFECYSVTERYDKILRYLWTLSGICGFLFGRKCCKERRCTPTSFFKIIVNTPIIIT